MASNVGKGRVILKDGKEYFVTPDGYENGMGLKIASTPELAKDLVKAYRPLGKAFEVWEESKIRKVLDDPKRVRARDLFPAEQIKDQDGRGACVGYAGAAAEEELQQREGKDYVALSGDGLYAAINGGVDQGSMLNDAMDFMQGNGIPYEDDVKRWEYRKSKIPNSAYEAGKDNAARECFVITKELELLTAICLNLPCVVAVQASGGFSDMDENEVSRGGNGPGNHCVLIDDAEYNKKLGLYLFDMRNSWRTSFGNQGRIKLIWKKHFTTSVKYARFFAVTNATSTK